MLRKILKRFIPEPLVRRIEAARDQIKARMVPFFAKSSLLTALYFLFSGTFKREFRAVINGMVRYRKESQSGQLTQYKLRRNIHRIEKGLLMRPLRDVFARDFIGETVAVYRDALADAQMSDACELEWASDVLNEYFKVVKSDPAVEPARALFQGLQPYSGQEERRKVPYALGEKTPAVAYEHLLELARGRKSVRWYQQKPVPRELLDQAVMLAGTSPSACNRQAFEYFIVDDPALAYKVISLTGGARGVEENIPVIVAVVGKMRAYPNEYDRHLIYIDGSLSAMAFVLALESLGLSSCVMNWPDKAFIESRAAALLGLKADERITMLIAVGYADPEGKVAFSQRKPLGLMRRYIAPEPKSD